MSNEVWYREKGVTHEISGSHSAVAADSGLVGCGTVFQVLTVLSLRIQVLWDVAPYFRFSQCCRCGFRSCGMWHCIVGSHCRRLSKGQQLTFFGPLIQ